MRVGPKGQVVVPKAVRDRLGIRPGDEVLVDEVDGEVRIRRARTLADLVGILPDGASTADLEAERRSDRELEERKAARWLRSSTAGR